MTGQSGSRARLVAVVRRRRRLSVLLVALLGVLLIVGAATTLRSDDGRPESGPDAAGSGGTGGGTATSAPGPPGDTATRPPAGQAAPSDRPGSGNAATETQAPAGGVAGGAGTEDGSGSGDGAGSDLAPVARREPVRCASTGAPRAAPLPSVDEQGGRRWVTVGRLAGNCDAASAPFRLLGIDTRLVWRSDADSFAVFLVDAGAGRDATAGFADGQCAGSCSERQAIVPPAGEYTLEVQAGDAPWEVEVQEYRQP